MKQLLILGCLSLGSTAFAQQKIKPEEAASHVGDSVQVCGKVFGGKLLASKMALLNIGGNYPDNPFTVVLPQALRAILPGMPEVEYKGKNKCFTGRIELYKEKPQMVLSQASQVADDTAKQ